MSRGDPGAADERVVSLEDVQQSEAIMLALASRRALPAEAREDPVAGLLAALGRDVDAGDRGVPAGAGARSATTCPSSSKRGGMPGRVLAASLAAAAAVVAVAVIAYPPQPVRIGDVPLAGAPQPAGRSIARASATDPRNPHVSARRGWQASGCRQLRAMRRACGHIMTRSVIAE